ncbi:uncharacterized protein CTRU02_203352 [Colletotrichum truncatum]|uniref:Uncharacterized protein n=1 Tax=Colletotrichum truncatum TaxID=5467 RepID=A0ACC3Z8Z3_COLTU
MKFETSRLFASASFVALATSINVIPSQPDSALAAAAVKDPIILAATSPHSFPPDLQCLGTFTNGPGGLDSGVIMSTGRVADAPTGFTPNTNFGFAQGSPLKECAYGIYSEEHNYFGMFITIPPTIKGLRIRYLFATQEPHVDIYYIVNSNVIVCKQFKFRYYNQFKFRCDNFKFQHLDKYGLYGNLDYVYKPCNVSHGFYQYHNTYFTNIDHFNNNDNTNDNSNNSTNNNQ